MTNSITDAVLAEIASISADAIICINGSQCITFFNEGAEGIFGYRADEIIGQPIDVLIPQRFRPEHSRNVEDFGQSPMRARRMGERRAISGLRKNGEEFPAEAAISHLGVGDSQVYSVVLRDITRRLRLETSLRFLAKAGETLASSLGTFETVRASARLAVPTLADACIVSVYYAGAFHETAVAHIDPLRAQYLQQQREEIPLDPLGPHPVAEVIRTGRALLIPDAAIATPQLRSFLGETEGVFEEGLSSSALFLPLIARGQSLGVLGLHRCRGATDSEDIILAEDVSRRVALAIDNARLHEQVMLGLRDRDDMIGIVAHDLRNPANAVKMLMGSILATERDYELPSDVIEYSKVAIAAAEQMDSLIRDLLDVTRIEAGRMNVEAEPTDVTELLADALGTLTPVAGAKSIKLALEPDGSLPPVQADRERIRQAVSNLIGNSIKFSPPDTAISITAATAGREVVVSVSDQGVGMTDEQLSHAFDRFWQSRRTDREGAGLGLAITRGIIEAHGGRIWAESTMGEGCTFHFTLPVAATHVTAAERARPLPG